MELAEVARKMLKPSKQNGGWGDPRDHQLCSLNTRPVVTGGGIGGGGGGGPLSTRRDGAPQMMASSLVDAVLGIQLPPASAPATPAPDE